MKVRCITLGAFQVNAYLLEDSTTGHCAVVDTGEGPQLAKVLAELQPRPNLRAILLTHAHFDHAGGLADLQKEFPEAMTWLPALERPMYDLLPQQGSLLFGMADFDRPLAWTGLLLRRYLHFRRRYPVCGQHRAHRLSHE